MKNRSVWLPSIEEIWRGTVRGHDVWNGILIPAGAFVIWRIHFSGCSRADNMYLMQIFTVLSPD